MKKPVLFALLFIFLVRHQSTLFAQYWTNCMGGISNGTAAALYADGSTNLLYVGGDFNNAGVSLIPSNGFATITNSSWTDACENDDGAYTTCITKYDDLIYHGLYTGELYSSSQNDAALVQSFDGPIYAMAVLNNDLFVAGAFTHEANPPNKPFSYIARWDGIKWNKVSGGMKGNKNFSGIYALAVYNNELYAGGNFDSAGGTACSNIARWNGNEWFPVGTGVTNALSDTVNITCFTTFESSLVAGGIFNAAGGIAAANIASWDGSAWHSFVSVFNKEVAALAVYKGKLYAGGYFDYIMSENCIASWDGSNWSLVGAGITEGKRVACLAEWNNTLVIGGEFSEAGGMAVSNLATWSESPFGITSPSSDSSLKVWPNPVSNKLYVQSSENDPIKKVQLADEYGTHKFSLEFPGFSSGTKELSVSNFKRGMALLLVTTLSGTSCRKIIIE